MKIRLEFDRDNAVFEDDLIGEVTSILEQATRHLEINFEVALHGSRPMLQEWRLRDSNGNTVGFLKVET